MLEIRLYDVNINLKRGLRRGVIKFVQIWSVI
jgi:hypothetical protein